LQFQPVCWATKCDHRPVVLSPCFHLYLRSYKCLAVCSFRGTPFVSRLLNITNINQELVCRIM
jgi:hypothetical protein